MKKTGSLLIILSAIAVIVASHAGDIIGEKERNEDKDGQGEVSIVRFDSVGLEIPIFTSDPTEQIIKHTEHTLSYNKQNNEPNWVAWQLTDAETQGEEKRTDDFLPDPQIVEPHQVISKDYSKSGYDRGHMVPSADMKFSKEAMKESFYMSNICPQNPKLNQHDWRTLENACRRWAKAEGCVYIACGPVFYDSPSKKIGKYHKIAVPDAFFKVVLSTLKGKEKAIGFLYRNTAEKQKMESVATTVDQIEQITKMDFFSLLPDQLENEIEAKSELKKWH